MLLLAIGVYFLMALFSYSPDDPSWVFESAKRHADNAGGVAGAWAASVLFMLFGKVAYVFPLMIAWGGWLMFRERDDEIHSIYLRVARWVGFVMIVLTATSLAARGLDALGTVKSARLVERIGREGSGAERLLGRFRRFARRRLDLTFGDHSQGRALAGAMLLGDRAALDPLTMRRLRGAGLIHLVAISGLHVGLLGCVVLIALERVRLPGILRALLVVSFLLGFGQHAAKTTDAGGGQGADGTGRDGIDADAFRAKRVRQVADVSL